MLSDDRVKRAKQVDLREVIQLEKQRPYAEYTSGMCPFHVAADKNAPNFLVYKSRFLCLSSKCGKRGDIFSWFAYKLYGDSDVSLKNGKFSEVLSAILEESKRPTPKLPGKVELKNDQEDVNLYRLAKAYHKNLMNHPDRMVYFFSRGFSLETVLSEMWGWDGENYVITVWQGRPQASELLSLRLRNGGSSGSRYTGVRGHNQQMLYNKAAILDAIEKDLPYIVVFYGEFDARLAYQDGICAASPTNGAKSLLAKWFDGYKGKKIIFPDKGEERDAYTDANQFGVDGYVGHFPKGTFKDYTEFRQTGGSVEQFLSVIGEVFA